MNNYLFSQNLLIIVSIVCGILCYASFRKLYKSYSHKLLLVLALASGLLLAIEMIFTAKTVGLDNTPSLAYAIAGICNFVLLLLIVSLKHSRRLSLLMAPSFVALLLLLALTVNNYYQYFPNISSLFVKNYLRAHEMSSLSETHTKKHYNLIPLEQKVFSGGQVRGAVTMVNIPGTASGLDARDSYVYLPPAYYDASLLKTRFPVLILLVGVPGNPSSWLQGGFLVSIMDNFASRHEGITPIVVIADQSGSFTNDTECLNSSHGNAETYLTVDVPNYIKAHYRASTNPINWGIGGFSEGGMCAAMLTLTHQNVFRHFLDLSGDPDPFLDDYSQTLPVLFHNSKEAMKEHGIDWLLQHKDLQPDLTAQFAIGGGDSRKLIGEMKRSYYGSLKRNIPTSLEIIANGGHSFSTWSQAYNDALPKLSYFLGATECETNCVEYR